MKITQIILLIALILALNVAGNLVYSAYFTKGKTGVASNNESGSCSLGCCPR